MGLVKPCLKSLGRLFVWLLGQILTLFVDQISSVLVSRQELNGAVHAMSDIYDANVDSIDCWGVLLVDASNAFNSIRIAVLLYACGLWPRCSRFLLNTYHGWSVLVLWGSSDFCTIRKTLPRVIPYQCLCMLLGHYL